MNTLTENIFQGDFMEKSRMKAVVTDFTVQTQKLEAELLEATTKLAALKSEANGKDGKLHDQTKLLAKMKREKDEAERELRTALKKMTVLSDRIAVFSADSGVDLEDLERALDIVKREREDPAR